VNGLEEDYPAQLNFVNELQGFAKESGGHIHLVAHPRKMDETTRVRKMDVKGSSSIPNNADNILAVRRNVQKQDADDNGRPLTGGWDAEISVEKQRETGWQGVIKLAFDLNPSGLNASQLATTTNENRRATTKRKNRIVPHDEGRKRLAMIRYLRRNTN
jgi:DnaB-like helicase C terminal domain